MSEFKVFVGPYGSTPTKGSPFSAGWDLYSSEDVTVSYGKKVCVGTGIKVSIPRGYYGRIAPRSGLAFKNGVVVLAGVIDCDYRGEIKVILTVVTEGDSINIEKGDRIAQLILTKYGDHELEEVYEERELGSTSRGEGGFGSTGVSDNSTTGVSTAREISS